MNGNLSVSFAYSPGGPAPYQASPGPTLYKGRLGKPFQSQEPSEDYDGMLRLKGTCWPGMNLFDAANQEMKRMRNQRKDKSVIDQMEAFSATISRDEYVYNLDFDLERIRDVYGSPSVASSPVSLPAPRWLAMVLP